MQRFLIAVVIACLVNVTPVWALTTGTATTVTMTIPAAAVISLVRDGGSVTRGAVGDIVFDRYDLNDPGVSGPSADFMYAPYRSETGANWHLVQLFSNGATMTLSAAVTGTLGSTPLDTVLSLFCGGFFPSAGGGAVSGTASTDWEPVNTYSQLLSTGFDGTVSMGYRLTVTGQTSGASSGGITYTLTTT